MIFIHSFFSTSITIIVLIILLIKLISICFYVYRLNDRNKNHVITIERKRWYSSPESITLNYLLFPLSKRLNNHTIEMNAISSLKIIHETLTKYCSNEMPSIYKTFDLTKKFCHDLSLDSLYEDSFHQQTRSQSLSFD